MFKRLTFVFAVTCAIGLSMVQALAQGVTVIQGAGTASAINSYQFAGQGNLRIGHVWVSETSLASIVSLAPGAGHSLLAETTHTLTCGSLGTITTVDATTLTPVNDTGLYQLSIRARIVGGTGQFAGATGRLNFNGFANLATGQVTWMVEGQID
jgi:hypothetical protein